jgi:hypothetical protein
MNVGGIKGKLIKLPRGRAPITQKKWLWLARYLFDLGNAYLFGGRRRPCQAKAREAGEP